MTTIGWDFYLSRKSIRLEDFLKSSSTLEEAYNLFDNKKLTRPPEELIQKVLIANQQAQEEKQRLEALPNPTAPRKKRKSPSKAKNEKKDEKYFRKVLPSKK